MAFKLLDSAQDRWRHINGYQPTHPFVRTGATFIDGQLHERRDTDKKENGTDEDAKDAA